MVFCRCCSDETAPDRTLDCPAFKIARDLDKLDHVDPPLRTEPATMFCLIRGVALDRLVFWSSPAPWL